MKPFDLEEALAGYPLTTKEGLTVTDFTKNNSSKYPYKAFVNNIRRTFTANGKWSTQHESYLDLFLTDTEPEEELKEGDTIEVLSNMGWDERILLAVLKNKSAICVSGGDEPIYKAGSICSTATWADGKWRKKVTKPEPEVEIKISIGDKEISLKDLNEALNQKLREVLKEIINKKG